MKDYASLDFLITAKSVLKMGNKQEMGIMQSAGTFLTNLTTTGGGMVHVYVLKSFDNEKSSNSLL